MFNKSLNLILIFALLGLTSPLRGNTGLGDAPVHKLGGDWVMREWLVLGPFKDVIVKDSRNKNVHTSFTGDLLKSFGGEEKAVLKSSSRIRYKDENGEIVLIKPQRLKANREGVIPLGGVYGHGRASAYAFSYIYAEEDMAFMFYFGSGDCGKVWVNGKRVHGVVAGRGSYPHSESFVTHLNKGYNTVLVKIFNYAKHWDFILEGNKIDSIAKPVLDSEGVPIHSLGEDTFVRNWLIIGGFANERTKKLLPDGTKYNGFSTDYLASLGGEGNIKLNTKTSHSYANRIERTKLFLPVRAETLLVHADINGFVAFDRYIDHYNYKCGYAFCYIKSDKEQTVRCYYGANDLAKIWVNSNVVAKKLNNGYSIARDKTVEFDLKKGLNPVMVKICNDVGLWSFVFEIEAIE
jgi:hypothetical protein